MLCNRTSECVFRCSRFLVKVRVLTQAQRSLTEVKSRSPDFPFLSRSLWLSSTPGMADVGEGKALPGEEPVKSAKQLKKEAQKRERDEKFLSKQIKMGNLKAPQVFLISIFVLTSFLFPHSKPRQQ